MLFAAGWLQLLILLLFFVVPAVLKALRGNPPEPERPRRARRPAPRGDAPQPIPADDPQRKALEAEVEAFLRQVRGERPAEPVAAEPIAARPVPGERPDATARTLRREPMVPKRRRADGGRPRPARPVRQAPAEAPRPAAQPAPDRAADRPLSRLSRSVDDEVQRLDEHVHSVFDHKLGSLDQAEEAAPQAVKAQADAAQAVTASERRQKRSEAQLQQASVIRDILRNPATVRQAIVLAEIIRRPEF